MEFGIKNASGQFWKSEKVAVTWAESSYWFISGISPGIRLFVHKLYAASHMKASLCISPLLLVLLKFLFNVIWKSTSLKTTASEPWLVNSSLAYLGCCHCKLNQDFLTFYFIFKKQKLFLCSCKGKFKLMLLRHIGTFTLKAGAEIHSCAPASCSLLILPAHQVTPGLTHCRMALLGGCVDLYKLY